MNKLEVLKQRVENFIPVKSQDLFALETIKVAIDAAEKGNFGVGAILVDRKTGEIVCRGQNNVFTDSRSDLHAEMDLMNNFENANGANSRKKVKKLAIYTSLESCPMCLCRLITSGIPEVYHIADDETGGMVHLFNQLPKVWQEIATGRVYAKANCSAELSEIAEQIFLATVQLNDKL
jgi:cytosine deaminase